MSICYAGETRCACGAQPYAAYYSEFKKSVGGNGYGHAFDPAQNEKLDPRICAAQAAECGVVMRERKPAAGSLDMIASVGI